MSHKSLFERMEREIDFKREIEKFEGVICTEVNAGTTIEQVFEHFFRKWKHRDSYMSLSELRHEFAFDFQTQLNLNKRIRNVDAVDFFQYCELMANLALSLSEHIQYNGLSDKLQSVLETMQLDLAKVNHRFFGRGDGRTIVIEINSATTAVSEIVEPVLSDKIIEYNHYLLRGDLAKKREILRALAHKFEAIIPALKQINAPLEDKASYLLNTMNIRHNNKDKTSKHYKPIVEKISEADLEHWYDETYQTLLFAILAVDQAARNQSIDELKAKISEFK